MSKPKRPKRQSPTTRVLSETVPDARRAARRLFRTVGQALVVLDETRRKLEAVKANFMFGGKGYKRIWDAGYAAGYHKGQSDSSPRPYPWPPIGGTST